jgi:UDP-GlcNAc:undecaprenyl-phosphate/decaprenyl-phosphate GlcNAc-1-phosphate transferase
MVLFALVVLVGSFATSLSATWVVRRVARVRGFVDRPGGHKQHASAVALGGGVAITWTVVLPILAITLFARAYADAPPDWLPEFVGVHLGGIASKAPGVFVVLSGALVLHIVGLIDDVKPLGPGIKFVFQSLVALTLAVVVRIRVLELEALPEWVSVSATVIWIVLIINAFNFLDNMDGLSAGVAAIAGTIFALASFGSGQIFVPMTMLILVGALLGFLVFNFAPASVFMGDSGSLVVGYFVAVLIVLTTFYDPTQHLEPAGVLLPIVVLAVPLYDVISVMIHRLRAGVSVFRGDRRHFSHRLVRRGLSERSAVLTIYLATAATSLAAVLLPHVDWYGASLIFAQCLCVVCIIAVLEHTEKEVASDKKN